MSDQFGGKSELDFYIEDCGVGLPDDQLTLSHRLSRCAMAHYRNPGPPCVLKYVRPVNEIFDDIYEEES